MAPRTLLVVCVIVMLMLSVVHANVITSCTADIGISGCDDAEGCTYNATYAANGTSVRFTVTVRTDTWVGIGFSLDRFMPNTDVVVGAVDGNSDFFVEDRNVGAGRVQPTVDASQDISDLAAWAGNGLVGIEFTRPRVTPASNDDDISLDQPVYFLFAWGGSLNFATRTLGQHTNANRQPSDAPYMIPANCVNGVADCGLLIDPANGDITYSDGTVEGSVATYMCDPGFMLEGEMTRNCGSNGEWTGPAVACVAEGDDDDDDGSAGMIQASLLVMALMVVVATFGF